MKQVLFLICLIISLQSFSQKKINEIITIEGKFNSYFMYEGEYSFKIDKTTITFTAGPLDKNDIKCKIDDELDLDISSGNFPEGTKLKVKAKAVYAIFSPVCDGCTTYKALVWKPLEITRIK